MRRILTLTILFMVSIIMNAQTLALDSIKQMQPEEGLFYALEYFDLYEPHIVYAQAVLETGHFTSNLCKRGNLFGIFDSRKKQYKTYGHWIESVMDYRDSVQNKYKGGDYYYFLENLPYAADPDYINKVRRIAEKYVQYD